LLRSAASNLRCTISEADSNRSDTPRNFRPGPDQKRELAVISGTRHQFRVAEIRETRAGIRCRTDHHLLITALDKDIGDVLTQPAALRYCEEMVLTLRLGAKNGFLEGFGPFAPAGDVNRSSSASSRVILGGLFDKMAIRSPKAARAEWSISFTNRPMTSSNREVCDAKID
jgi:hypothetical protein